MIIVTIARINSTLRFAKKNTHRDQVNVTWLGYFTILYIRLLQVRIINIKFIQDTESHIAGEIHSRE